VNLVADESLDREIVERLRRDGHAVTYVAKIDAGIDARRISRGSQES
jgi:hypothetical protein